MREDRLIVGYESALGFWRATRAAAPVQHVLEPSGRTYGALRPPLSERARRVLALCGGEAPLDVVVSRKEERHNCDLIADHVWRGPLTREHLVDLGQGVSVCVMPAVFSQLAYSFDEISLAEIAYEMTGTYGIAPWEDDGAHARLEPLVDVAGLCGYATSARLLGVRGARRACAALDIVVPGSNSPRETDTAIFLSLGRGRGGLGAAGFKMNAPVALPDRLASMVGQKTIVPDFSWPNGTVMEYDSDQEHQSPAARARDERKRRAYRAEGMDCLTLTNGILRSNHELNLFCEELEKSLGLRRTPASERMLVRRRELRQRLFGLETESAALLELSREGEA